VRLTRVRIARRKARRIGLHHKTLVAAIGGVLAVLPAVAASDSTDQWTKAAPSTEHTRNVALVGGFDPKMVQVSVDGSLPKPPVPTPTPLPPYDLPSGPLGIPGTALKAYRNAANMLTAEQPTCHIDWALIASIGRIESNHARGGYVDTRGNTLEPILGPELDGIGGFAAIPDTDHGRWDHDTVWDRAVGPTQFIPSTWVFYGADGNHDGVADPNNIYDATLATGRYLCSGGLDLANPDQLRTGIYRYNNSDIYVDTVIVWAEAYRKGVAPLPDSRVPIGAPTAPAMPAMPALPSLPTPPRLPPVTTSPPTPTTTRPTTSSPRASTTGPGTTGTSTPSTGTTAPPCSSGTTSSTTTTTPPTTTPPPQDSCTPATTSTTGSSSSSVAPTS
jgi:Transglycosylase SLT domain